MAELNINWRYVSEEDKLINRSCHWWEISQLNCAYNLKSNDRSLRQFGGVAVWSIRKPTHRILSKGWDSYDLGRWVWTRYKERGNSSLKFISTYRPTTPQGGPYTVYAQHCSEMLANQDDRCPRMAFIEDFAKGDEIILMLDRNESVVEGQLHKML
jgi:hypothetical protein